MEGQNTHCTKDWRHVRNPILTNLAIFIAKGAFRDYKTTDELLDIEPPGDEEMYQLHWDPRVLREVTDKLIHLVRTARVFVSWASVLGTFGPLRTMALEQRASIFSVSNSSPLLVASLCLTDLRPDKQ